MRVRCINAETKLTNDIIIYQLYLCFHHQGDSGGPLVKFEKIRNRNGKIVKKVFLIGTQNF